MGNNTGILHVKSTGTTPQTKHQNASGQTFSIVIWCHSIVCIVHRESILIWILKYHFSVSHTPIPNHNEHNKTRVGKLLVMYCIVIILFLFLPWINLDMNWMIHGLNKHAYFRNKLIRVIYLIIFYMIILVCCELETIFINPHVIRTQWLMLFATRKDPSIRFILRLPYAIWIIDDYLQHQLTKPMTQ